MVAIPGLLEQGDSTHPKKLNEMTVEERKAWFKEWMKLAEKNRASSPVLSEEEMEAEIRYYRFGIRD